MSDPFDPTANPAKPPRNPPPINCAVPVETPVQDGDDEPFPKDDSTDD